MAELVEFAKTGNLAKVRECVLKDGCDVNFRCPADGSTALYWAACSGHVHVCDWLINSGADIDMATTKSGSIALHGAADRGHYDCVALLLRRGCEIDRQTTTNGDTALHLAAYRGDLSVCRLLLDHGAKLSMANKQGRMALEESQIKDHHEVSRMLVEHSLVRERQGCLSRKVLGTTAGASDFASAKDDVTFESDSLSLASSQNTSEYVDAEDPHSLATTLVPSTDERWPLVCSRKASPAASGCQSFEASGHFDLSTDDVSDELVRHLRLKISALEAYTNTLLIELTAKDANLERLRRDNSLLRQQLDVEKALTATPEKVPPAAEVCADSKDGATGELDELRRRCRELEQVIFDVKQELRNCDRSSPKENDDNESHV